MRSRTVTAVLLLAGLLFGSATARSKSLTLEEAVALAKEQNLDIAVARKQLEAARGSLIEARAGFLPSVISSGLLRQREHQEQSRLRNEDYNASVRIVQNLYTGGAISSQTAIARLNVEKQVCELQVITDRVIMDVRVAYYQSLLDRANIKVREQSVRVFQEELKTQQERFTAGLVGELNVRRAEGALANDQPELIDAQTRLQNGYLRLRELLALQPDKKGLTFGFQLAGQLQYQPRHPDLNECLAYADTARPELLSREKDVAIAEEELKLDRSELRPRVEVFSGYELYNERDPEIGREFNHGYVVGLNATWHLFDGFATRGRMQATRARRDAALQALRAARLAVATDVRSAFLDLQQADRTLIEATKNVQNADQSLEIAKGNLGAGLGTQLDTLQAASDVTRTRTTRLTAIFLHNVALARLARATARDPQSVEFKPKLPADIDLAREQQVLRVARPPSALGTHQ